MTTRKAIDLRIITAENKIKRECIDRGKPYLNPLPDIYSEPANKRKVRRKRMRISFLDDDAEKQRKEKNRIATRKRRQDIANGLYTPRIPTPKKNELKEERTIQMCCPKHSDTNYKYCDKAEWSATPNCKYVKVPLKEKIEITGINGHPIYASASIDNAKYIIGDLTLDNLDNEVHYCKREIDGAVKHMFSIVFSNNFMLDKWRYKCTLDDILKCEIRINGIIIGTMMDSPQPMAQLCQLQNDDFLRIKHKFTFEHGATSWGYYESFNMNLLCGPLSKDMSAILMNNKALDNFSYSQITHKGISSIKFVDIHFRETHMKRSSYNYRLHYIAWKELYQKKVGKRMSNEELGKALRQIIEAENKVKYWKCLKGYQNCHEWKTKFWRCRECIDHFHHRDNGEYHNGERPPSKEDFPLCLAGHNMCHDGILQCPECKKANAPQNKPQWKYMDSRWRVHSFLTYEECNRHYWEQRQRRALNW